MSRNRVMSALFVAIIVPSLFGQSKVDSQIPLLENKNFVELTELRQTLEKEILTLQQEVDALTAKVQERESLERDQPFLERAYKNAGPDIPKSVKNAYKDQARNAKARLEYVNLTEPKEKLVKDLGEKQTELANKRREKERVEQRISQLIDIERPRQEFKKTMSVYFAVLVALVIVGFFIIAWHDETVRRAIFSGQAGIQFITLFSLVISIILFGITGVLQDKELSALLGGLSGYILGRGTASGNSRAGQGEA